MNEKDETMIDHGFDILNFNRKSETTAIMYVATVLKCLCLNHLHNIFYHIEVIAEAALSEYMHHVPNSIITCQLSHY